MYLRVEGLARRLILPRQHARLHQRAAALTPSHRILGGASSCTPDDPLVTIGQVLHTTRMHEPMIHPSAPATQAGRQAGGHTDRATHEARRRRRTERWTTESNGHHALVGPEETGRHQPRHPQPTTHVHLHAAVSSTVHAATPTTVTSGGALSTVDTPRRAAQAQVMQGTQGGAMCAPHSGA
jgi:hypothetical protein